MYLSQAWTLYLIAQVAAQKAPQCCRLADACVDWVLGGNPLNICMLQGAGTFNLKRLHHRYEAIKGEEGVNYGNVPGAICNGVTRRAPKSDRPFPDLVGNSYQTNEPWLPHNEDYDSCGGGQPAYEPAMMVNLLLHAYCVGMPFTIQL